MPFSANQTKMYYSKYSIAKDLDKSSVVIDMIAASIKNELDFLMEVPELGGVPEKTDVTTLSDKSKKYISGIKDYGDLVFKFLYDNSDENANYRILKDLDDQGTTAAFKIKYPDGTSHIFEAIPSVRMDAGTINGALTFSATLMLQSDVRISNPEEE